MDDYDELDAKKEDEDLFLSDVHVENEVAHVVGRDDAIYKTEIEFQFSPKNMTTTRLQDDDGDLIVKRPAKYKLILQHKLQTNLSLVGLQLWKGAFYLCDYLLSQYESFTNVKCIDLGCGCGLTTLVCSLFAEYVYGTDLGFILESAEANFILNKSQLENISIDCFSRDHLASVQFKEVNWSNYSHEDNNEYSDANLLVASDVIYDEQLTIDFLNYLYRLMCCKENQPKQALISLEKRINFDASELSECSTCYDLFEKSMLELNDYIDEVSGIMFKTELIQMNEIAKYFINYERNSYLFLWKVSSCRVEYS